MSTYAQIVVTCNGLRYTRACLDSIQGHKADTLILDNGSTDGTQQYLFAQHDKGWGSIILGCKFPSLAAAWNHGLTQVFNNSTYNSALVINNDTELLPEMGWTLYGTLMSPPKTGLVSGVSVRSTVELEIPKEITAPTPHPDFSCFLLSKQCYEDVGPFDERFLGAYCEDCDYHVRIHRAGYRAVAINFPFLHHECGTLKSANDVRAKEILDMADQNRERFYKKWGKRIGTPEYDELFL